MLGVFFSEKWQPTAEAAESAENKTFIFSAVSAISVVEGKDFELNEHPCDCARARSCSIAI